MNSDGFNSRYTYTGDDLGNTYSPQQTRFRVWAPTATNVDLVTYSDETSPLSQGVATHMSSDSNGTWIADIKGDLNGTIYNYRVSVGGVEREAVDPYVRATTINGIRGVVVDLAKTNPKTWTSSKPSFSGKSTDAVIYELNSRQQFKHFMMTSFA
jgi:pullulanase